MANSEVIQQLIESSVVDMGFQLWGVQIIASGKHTTLRVYIDKDGGITVDDCADVSHLVSGILDVEDPFQGRYTLEVSSPGLERELFTLEQYQQYVGYFIKLSLRVPFDGRRRFKGLLSAIEDDEIVLQIDDEEYVLPFEMIEKANVVFKD